MEESISKTPKAYWVLWHPLKPSVWGECSACLTLIPFPHLNTFPSLSTHRVGSGVWSLADAVWKEGKYVTSTGSGAGSPEQPSKLCPPFARWTERTRRNQRRWGGRSLAPWVTDGSREPCKPVTRSIRTGALQDPGQSARCAPPPASWAVPHTVGRVCVCRTVRSRSEAEETQPPFLQEAPEPLPSCLHSQPTLCSRAAGVFSNK